MPIQFDIQSVAIHFVDKEKKKLTLSPSEVDLASYNTEDRATILGFLREHLFKAWDAEAAGKTRVATFASGSAVQSAHQTLAANPSPFFQISVALAKSLYQESPLNASPGLLLVLWFVVPDAPRPFLALFKLEPGKRDQVALKSRAGQLLLDLAVEHIQWALPTPDRVLKWALIPHPPTAPEEPQFDLKIRDAQSRADPATYFTQRFLGCAARPSTRKQVETAFDVLGKYAEKAHPEESWQRGLEPLVQALQQEKVITAGTVARLIKATVLPDLDENAFANELAAANAGDLRAGPALVQGLKIRYNLPGGIQIEGSAAAMAAIAVDKKEDGSVEFRIPTTRGYTTKVFLSNVSHAGVPMEVA